MATVKVLDHGHVELVDVMGGDAEIVAAARVSISGEGVRPVSEDRALIRYLLRHRHTTPFEMVVFKFRVKAPIFVFRQWHRHRMASINEMSARYSEMPEQFYVPQHEHVAFQATQNKQGRAETVPYALAGHFQDAVCRGAAAAFHDYHTFIGRAEAADIANHDCFDGDDAATLKGGGGIARELARINLPLGTYSEMIWKIDLHNLLHFLRLRLDEHAQYEIRAYAEVIAEMVQKYCPLAYEAFVDYQLQAVTLSLHEQLALRAVVGQLIGETGQQTAVAAIIDAAMAAVDWPTKRERDEAWAKFGTLLEWR